MLTEQYNSEFEAAVLRELGAKASNTRYELQHHSKLDVYQLPGLSELHWNNAWQQRQILNSTLNRAVCNLDGLEGKRVYLKIKRRYVSSPDPRYPEDQYYYWRTYLEVKTRKYCIYC